VQRPDTQPRRARRARLLTGPALLCAFLLLVPTAALAAANWGFGVGGQATATITWQPDNGEKVTSVAFSLPVKVKRAKTRLGRACTVPKKHPRQVRCRISPAVAYGYVDVVAKARIPCKHTIGFSVKPVGQSRYVRQQDIPSGNGCG
jgi:hypothetical protein